ncbi:MAG: type II secretion system protein GspD [Elusimicrobiota bacterium]
MMRQRILTALAVVLLVGKRVYAQTSATPLIEISADIIEISGSVDNELGVTWPPFQSGINFAEALPTGIFKLGDFARQTALQASLTMLTTEGKAQTLANPKVIVQAGSQADFKVGSKIPYPVVGATGSVGVDLKDVVTMLEVKPILDPNQKGGIVAALYVTNETPNFSQTVQVGNTSVPSITDREIKSTVEVKSGDTIVIGGLKSSSKNVSTVRVPFLGSIPILGWLFTKKSDIESEDSLYLFITMRIVK